ncbi:MAG: hypothetical protein A2788_00625 [Candidatus Abawacabacteria bacterium RIFCSPHIGHO2_01_FULL_46_8]|uniref:Uncharacterized protein n=1 Tax=Candidatus Abawacabacteria bacterium RIFCSPHIGHO2_01_FULL_46_8 TaxID=1817815 RepID=A0A1F4XHR5_9BACT|nr:MAG: hypothetical protein A2788_00625 [Candidatus Abawacabacteria bacterium RIFCSPHIGHO2_01_FULL_46_8]
MEIKISLPPWPRLRFLFLFILPFLILAGFLIYLVISTSIYSLIYPKERPQVAVVSAPEVVTPEVVAPKVEVAAIAATKQEEPATATAEIDHLALAQKALAENDLNTAYAEYKKVVAADASILAARSQLRGIAIRLKQIEDLKAFYEQMITQQPKEAAYLISLGTIYMTIDRNTTKAKELFTKSLALDPGNSAALYNLSVLKNY